MEYGKADYLGLTTAAQDFLSDPGSGWETSMPRSIVGLSNTQLMEAGTDWKEGAPLGAEAGARLAKAWHVPPI